MPVIINADEQTAALSIGERSHCLYDDLLKLLADPALFDVPAQGRLELQLIALTFLDEILDRRGHESLFRYSDAVEKHIDLLEARSASGELSRNLS